MGYIVQIPNVEKEGEYNEYKYKNAKEVAEALGIGENTVFAIINGKCAFNRPCTMKLKDCIIYKDVKPIYNKDVVELMKQVEIEKRKSIEQYKEKIKKEKEEKIKALAEEFAKNMQNIEK